MLVWTGYKLTFPKNEVGLSEKSPSSELTLTHKSLIERGWG